MKQNIYDNASFYHGYMHLRQTNAGLNDVLEIPAFRGLLPDLSEKKVLDLGCGFGESCHWYRRQGAQSVVGVDISSKMIHLAQTVNGHPGIEYRCTPMEDLALPGQVFDVVTSSLAFHYIKDFARVIGKVYQWLAPGGILLFSQEHPVVTAEGSGRWAKDAAGRKLHWILDHYGQEGIRRQHWFVDGVIKYHRTISTTLNGLIDAGFIIKRVVEPLADDEAEALNQQLQEQRRRPSFLIVKVQKPKHDLTG